MQCKENLYLSMWCRKLYSKIVDILARKSSLQRVGLLLRSGKYSGQHFIQELQLLQSGIRSRGRELFSYGSELPQNTWHKFSRGVEHVAGPGLEDDQCDNMQHQGIACLWFDAGQVLAQFSQVVSEQLTGWQVEKRVR